MKKHIKVLIVLLADISLLFAACQPATAPAEETQPQEQEATTGETQAGFG